MKEYSRIAILLVCLALVTLPAFAAGTGQMAQPQPEPGPAPCDPQLAGADYVGGVDVEGNRVVPADVGPRVDVDLSQLTPVPVIRPGRRPEVVVQGVRLSDAEETCLPQSHAGKPTAVPDPH